MPIPDHDEREGSQADTGLLEYIDRRRLYQVRQRRQRILMGTTVALGLLAAVLAVSNVILLNRLNAASEAPPPASVATTPPAATPEPSAPAPQPAAPASQPSAYASEPVATAPAPPAPAPPAPAASGASAPAASAPSAATPDPAVRTPLPVTAAGEGDSARRTARWLVQTHGQVEAENRVTRVAEFYSGAEGAFWRRVLLNVRQQPER
jgi:hypothetical protein